jgi:hypothetical protein
MALTSTAQRLGLGHDLVQALEDLPELLIDFIEPLAPANSVRRSAKPVAMPLISSAKWSVCTGISHSVNRQRKNNGKPGGSASTQTHSTLRSER